MASLDARRVRVLQLRAQGMSYRQIADATGVNAGTAHRWVDRYFGEWQAAQAGAIGEAATTIATGPAEAIGRAAAVSHAVEPHAAPAGAQGDQRAKSDDERFEGFLKAVQLCGRVDVAAALSEVDEATLARWRRVHGPAIAKAKATTLLRGAHVLVGITTSPETTNRDRIQAAERLLQFSALDEPPAVDVAPGPPPVPVLHPQGPSEARCEACPAGTCHRHCPAGRWDAWVDRVCWARAKPGATDAVALQASGSLVSPADVALWLEQGRSLLESGDLKAPASRFAMRWAQAVAASVGGALEAHEAALLSGRAAATQAALATLAAVAPEEYGGRGDPRRLGASGEAEPPVARLLRLSYADDDEDDDL